MPEDVRSMEGLGRIVTRHRLVGEQHQRTVLPLELHLERLAICDRGRAALGIDDRVRRITCGFERLAFYCLGHRIGR